MRLRGHGLERGGGSDVGSAIVVVGRSLVRGERVFGGMLEFARAASRLTFRGDGVVVRVQCQVRCHVGCVRRSIMNGHERASMLRVFLQKDDVERFCCLDTFVRPTNVNLPSHEDLQTPDKIIGLTMGHPPVRAR